MNYCKKCVTSTKKEECPSCGAKTHPLPTKKKAKAKAWKAFSKFIRLRDCILTTGTKEEGVCYTCGKTFPIGKLQAGHLVHGRTNGVLFDEYIVKAQCYQCNIPRGGEQAKFFIHAVEEHSKRHGQSLEKAFESMRDIFYLSEGLSREYTPIAYLKIAKQYEKKAELLEALSEEQCKERRGKIYKSWWATGY